MIISPVYRASMNHKTPGIILFLFQLMTHCFLVPGGLCYALSKARSLSMHCPIHSLNKSSGWTGLCSWTPVLCVQDPQPEEELSRRFLRQAPSSGKQQNPLIYIKRLVSWPSLAREGLCICVVSFLQEGALFLYKRSAQPADSAEVGIAMKKQALGGK